MIISIAIAYEPYRGAVGAYSACEDFESAEEAMLYLKERLPKNDIKKHMIRSVVAAPLRATGLAMCRELRQLMFREWGL